PASQAQAKADRAATSDNNPALHRLSQNAEIAPKTSKPDPLGNMSSAAPIVFVAAVLVKNIGEKTVTSVQWEYLLFESGATEPVKRYRVQSKRIILPNEQVELIKEVTPRGHEQQARLLRIEYADGTFWHQSESCSRDIRTSDPPFRPIFDRRLRVARPLIAECRKSK